MLTQKQTLSKENNVKMGLCYNPFKNQGETDQIIHTSIMKEIGTLGPDTD
jgi:hypothetical protein